MSNNQDAETTNRFYAANNPELNAESRAEHKAIAILSETKAESVLDAKFIQEISKSNNLVDILIRELVKVRSGQFLTSEGVEKEQKQGLNKEIVIIDGQEIAKTPYFPTTSVSDVALQQLLFNVESPKLGSKSKKVEFREFGRSRTPIESDFLPNEIPVEELSASQSRGSVALNIRDKLQPILKSNKLENIALKRRQSVQSESYADDFEEISESLMMEDSDFNNSLSKRTPVKKNYDGLILMQ